MNCSLRHHFSVDIISVLKFDAGKLVWNHYLCNRSSTAVASVNVLKDMLLFRVAKDQCFLIRDEIQTIIQAVCIEQEFLCSCTFDFLCNGLC